MGTTLSAGDKVEPKDISNNGETNGIKQFGLTGRRYTTDVIALLLHTFFFVLLIPLLVYCVNYGDIYRIIHGYDNCLNVCGRDNTETNNNGNNPSCGAKNMSAQPYILVIRSNSRSNLQALLNRTEDNIKSLTISSTNSTIERACLANCSVFPQYRSLIHKCVLTKAKNTVDSFLGKTGLNDFFEEVSEDFELCWPEILYLCIISLAFSLIILVLFRLLVGIVVWLVLVGVALACCLGTAYLWVLWKQSKSDAEGDSKQVIGIIEVRKTDSYLAFAIIATIVTVCVVLIILVLRKRVQLVVKLFKEAGKAIASMPLLLIQPVWTFICIATAVSCWLYFTLWIESSGHQKKVRDDYYVYEKDTWMVLTRWYNILMTLWLLQFFIGCQHMVIAGAIACWYFTRNKKLVDSPIFYGLYNLLRYHIGSVSFGSLIIALVQFVRAILKILEGYLRSHEGKCVTCLLSCCQCCLCCFEKILISITKHAYIEIAIHGYNFCHAGKQALNALVTNALRVATINSVGDFILFLGKVLVVVATVLIGVELIQKKEGVLHAWVPLTLIGMLSFLISHCFLSVYEMAIDSIFICFCEDCAENDGLTKPYYMSRELMEFVENSNKSVLRPSTIDQAWQDKPANIS